MKITSVILLASKPASVIVLRIMLKLNWDIKAVVISPNSNYDWIPGKTLKEEAIENKIPIVEKQSLLDKNMKVDLVISYMYRNLVKEETLNMANKAAVNFHPGPLPKYAGWAFYNLAIIEEVKEYGCTCHYMDNNFDTGDILKVHTFPVDIKEETAVSLERKTQEEMIKLFKYFCKLITNNEVLPKERQDKNEMRYLSQKEFDALKEIPHNADKSTIEKYSRAFWYPPYECAYTKINDTKVEIIPEIVKKDIAFMLHKDDYSNFVKIEESNNENKFR